MSLRTRLALWYTIALTLVVGLFSVLVWSLLSFGLTSQLDQRLEQTANQVARISIAFNLFGERSIVNLPALDLFQSENIFIQALDLSGDIESASQNITTYDKPLDPSAIGVTAKIIRALTVNQTPMRVLTAPLATASGQIVGYLQIGAPTASIQQTLNILAIILLTVSIVIVVISSIAFQLTIGRALRPLDSITQTALQISRADDLSRRIPLMGSSTDEVGRLIQVFNETLERLEKLFNAQRRFLADMSHELRTPLTAVRGNIDLLRRMKTPDRESLDAIQSEVDRMSRLVGDLLVLAQAESGHLPIVKAEVELDTLFLEVYRQAQVLGRDKVAISLSEEDQARVVGDRDKLKQVLLNLVSNAIKYTPHGGAVTLGLACVNGWARVTVADTGVGIPPEDLPRVFDRFYRVDKARSREAGGAGLGLSIAKWLAQAHGGRLEVSSQVGKGSCFSLWLPLKTS